MTNKHVVLMYLHHIVGLLQNVAKDYEHLDAEKAIAIREIADSLRELIDSIV